MPHISRLASLSPSVLIDVTEATDVGIVAHFTDSQMHTVSGIVNEAAFLKGPHC